MSAQVTRRTAVAVGASRRCRALRGPRSAPARSGAAGSGRAARAARAVAGRRRLGAPRPADGVARLRGHGRRPPHARGVTRARCLRHSGAGSRSGRAAGRVDAPGGADRPGSGGVDAARGGGAFGSGARPAVPRPRRRPDAGGAMVVVLGSAWAAPLAGLVLRRLGADVVRVTNPRRPDPFPLRDDLARGPAGAASRPRVVD